MPVLASTTEKKVLLLMDGLMDELILISREYFRSTRQTNYDVVYITDDSSEDCIFIDMFQQERTLVMATTTTLRKLSKIIPHVKVFECPRYLIPLSILQYYK